MADINYINSGSLAEVPKGELQINNTLNELETTNGEAYMLRLLIEKVNELVTEVNTLKNQ
tara:strand:- start:38 stop:217 length:180 start_codon:yes stop_codon:yes gene_type:complete